LKILHIFHSSNLTNGVDRTTVTLAREFQSLGFEIMTMVPEKGSVSEILAENGISCAVFSPGCCLSPAWRAQLRFFERSSMRVKQLATMFRERRFDLVHLNTGHLIDGALAATVAGIPVLWHIHSPFEIDYQRYSSFLCPDGYAWILGSLGSRIISVSEANRATMLPYLPAERVHTVLNGIDIDDLNNRVRESKSDIRSELGIAADDRIILGVGRISAQKDFATFVSVAERVVRSDAKVRFLIAGPAEDRGLARALKEKIEDSNLSDRVFILGSRDDVPALMSQSDLYLSTAVYEGHPLTTLEAMALGLPVVAMGCVGITECIAHEKDGLLAVPGDVNGTASHILQLLGDENLRRSIAANAAATVQRQFSSRAYAERFLEAARMAIEYGPPRADKGAVEVVLGLLRELERASKYADRLVGRPGLLSRIKHAIQ
jgi:glycosyltransferase involved in cell wall biosynthesis